MTSFAVIKTGGKQYKVFEGDKLLIEKLVTPEGEEFDFEEVLLIGPSTHSTKPQGGEPVESTGSGQASSLQVGQPLVEGAKVRAKVLAHQRAEKKIVFKYHSKTRYKKKKGHRQPQTKVEILKITHSA